MKVQLKYIGTHRPQGMIIEVEEDKVNEFIKSGEYAHLDFMKKEIKKEMPTKKWTELQIYDWIKNNNIDIDYNPQRDKKVDVLEKINKYFKMKGGIE